MPDGRSLTGFTHEYKRHGTTTLFAAFNIATGQIHAGHYRRKRRIEFLDFMDQLVALHPCKELHVVLDNLSSHLVEKEKWVKQHPQVHFHYTPTHASWLNQVEVWFGILTEQALRGASFRSLSGPEIVEYFARLDPNVEQYSWSGGMPSRKQILQDCLARFPRDRQLQIIANMLDADIYRKYSPPTAEDRAFVRQWIDSQDMTTPSATTKQSVDLVFRERVQPTSDDQTRWDVFISHASEDKVALAKPLADALSAHGVRVWYDDFTLMVGDSLRKAIDRGLAQSRFGIVILSEAFFQKHWPQLELDGLVARESLGVKVILPVWHGVEALQIRQHSPTLADRVAVSSSRGLNHVVTQLMQVIRPGGSETAA
jgi:transposase